MMLLSCVQFGIRRCSRRCVVRICLLLFVVSVYVTVQPLLGNGKNYRPPGGGAARRLPASGGENELVDEYFGECRRPELDLWHPSMKQHYVVPEPLHCGDAPDDWVYVENGTFRISERAAGRRGKILCEYRPLVRINDSASTLGEPIRPFADGRPILSDFFEARCVSYNGDVYKNLHLGVRRSPEAVRRAAASRPPAPGATGLNVLMFGFDSVSRLSWLRNLPRSAAYFRDELGGVTLEGYNIVGDGTPQALLPILTGRTEQELPEARRGFPGARPVDGHPWIWRRFADAGYATQWGEDGAAVGTFNLRMLGFDRPPVDHYLRPYQLAAEADYHRANYRYCIGSRSRLGAMLAWIGDLFDAYPDEPKFSFVFHSEYSHGSFSTLSLADDELRAFLVRMRRSGRLNNTLLVLMADHGARFAEVRRHQQGKYEERLPYFSLRLPEWFADRYPAAAANLRINAKLLTTPFDVHETFLDVLNYTDRGAASGARRAYSLFQAIPKNRTCRQAGIAPHWCACMDWIETSLTDRHVMAAARRLVEAINELTAPQRASCARLALANVSAAVKFLPNERMLRFKRSLDGHGRSGDFSDKMAASAELYQVTVTTTPGGATFEGTVTHELLDRGEFVVDRRQISRINRYGDQPRCVARDHPHLRPYCYCTGHGTPAARTGR